MDSSSTKAEGEHQYLKKKKWRKAYYNNDFKCWTREKRLTLVSIGGLGRCFLPP